MKSGSMGGATVPAPRGPGSDVRRLGVFAVIAVLMMLSVAVVPLVTSGPASSQTAAPSDDYAGQDITYHYGSDESAIRTDDASLAIAEGWAAGQQYHYKVSIVAGKLTITVTVVDWNEEDTSVSWG